jgi:hypothetical protein
LVHDKNKCGGVLTFTYAFCKKINQVSFYRPCESFFKIARLRSILEPQEIHHDVKKKVKKTQRGRIERVLKQKKTKHQTSDLKH